MTPLIGITAYPRLTEIQPAPTVLHTVSRFYVDAVVRAGGCPVILPAIAPGLAPASLARLDGLLLPGGSDVRPARYGEEPAPETGKPDDARDEWELACVAVALDRRLPLLAICRGSQVLNVARGGSLVQHVPTATGVAHSLTARAEELVHAVRLLPGCRLAAIIGAEEVGANSLHHQAVGGLGAGVEAVGWAPDGTVEAIEVAGHPEVIAVQWHPELLGADPVHQRLFTELVRLAAQRAESGATPDIDPDARVSNR
ncbi:MAG: gamma-glutamyl-gamma-aminobutyrate hydrolase family protein [Acidimicrobiales bacterium]